MNKMPKPRYKLDKLDRFQLLESSYLVRIRETENELADLKARLATIRELNTESKAHDKSRA